MACWLVFNSLVPPLALAVTTTVGITDPASLEPTRLGYWRFNASSWLGENGQLPVQATNLLNVPSFDGNGLLITSSNGPAVLQYRGVESNGAANIFYQNGALRFVFKPFWASKSNGGLGPGQPARLWEMGDPDKPGGGMALWLDADGNNILFSSRDSSGLRFDASAAQSFAANIWYEITLAIASSPFNSPNRVRVWVYQNPVIDQNNIPNLRLPPANVWTNGFTVGSSADGSRQAQGLFDELETFNYDLGDAGANMNNNVWSAVAATNATRLDLKWRRGANALASLQRKSPGGTVWTTLTNTSAWGYSDTGTNLQPGQSYQYQLLLSDTPIQENVFLAGLNLPAVDNRGTIILLVDQTVAPALSNELNQLRQDLVGDGWTVMRHDVPRHDDQTWVNGAVNATYIANLARIKSIITNDYYTVSNPAKAVFILGHVTIPYAGAEAEDGHASVPADGANHFGAWPADAYYGDVDGLWTDRTVNYINPFNPLLQNLPGDGKFDQNIFPSPLELAVGRVDFARLPAFATGPSPRSETDLLRQYLNKDHRYRLGLATLPARAIMQGYLPSENVQFYREALVAASRWFGYESGQILCGDLFSQKSPCQWGFQVGAGGPTFIIGDTSTRHSTADFVKPTNEPPIAFYLLESSYLVDWNGTDDNFMRATLAMPNYGLASMWSRQGMWNLAPLALGGTLGDALVQTVNDPTQTRSVRTTYVLGDPSLRLNVLPPVTNLLANTSSNETTVLNWDASPEPATGYLVYRTTRTQFSSPADFVKLTLVPLAANTFADRSLLTGSNLYQVRAVRLTATSSGSYSNLSQGAFVTAVTIPYLVLAWGANESGQTNLPPELNGGLIAVAGGERHSLALRRDGTVAAWGGNNNQQTQVPAGLSKVVQIAAGSQHSLALLANGTVVAWGRNTEGQCVPPPGLSNVVQIAAGAEHSVALRSDGTVVVWGGNSRSQKMVPPGITNITVIAAGYYHTLAIKSDGKLVGWGFNDNGQLDIPDGLGAVVGISAGASNSLAIKMDGTVAAWGLNSAGQSTVPAGLSKVVAVAGGINHSLALRNDGTIVAWGDNTFGQTNLPSGIGPFVSIATGGGHNLALVGQNAPELAAVASPPSPVVSGSSLILQSSALGSLPLQYQWTFNGINLPGATNRWLVLSNAVLNQVGLYNVMVSNPLGNFTSSNNATIAVIPPFTPIAWGANDNGQTSIPSDLVYGVIGLAGGLWHTLALKRDGAIVAWGNNVDGQATVPGDLTSAVKIAAGARARLAIKKDGTVRAWGRNAEGQCNVPAGLSGVVAIAGGLLHSLALKSDGTVLAWGDNTFGQSRVPPGLSNVVAIASGYYHSLALKVDGTVIAWGYNVDGQINVPVNLGPFIAIAAGAWHSLAIGADGKARAWGQNYSGECNVPARLANVTAVVGGLNFSLALLNDGSVVGWGRNLEGQTAMPTGIGTVVSLAAGSLHALALVGLDAPGEMEVTGPATPLVNGSPVLFQGTAMGTVPLSFQWQLNGADLWGATNRWLYFSTAYFNQAGKYTLTASNSLGTLSAGITLNIINPYSLIAWGANDVGQTNIPPGWLNGIIAVAGGQGHTLALSREGTVAAWGLNDHGQTAVPPGLSNVVNIAAGRFHSLALRSDGTIVGWGRNVENQIQPPSGLNQVVAIAGGQYHSLALKRDGTVVAWGGNDQGQLNVPAGLSNVMAIASGFYHNLALKLDGTVIGWGLNSDGQLNIPNNLGPVVGIGAGGWHSLAVKLDGTVAAWGWNGYGQCAPPAGLSNVAAVVGGQYHSLALTSDGSISGWGDNTFGQIIVPRGIGPFVSLAAGALHSLSLAGIDAPRQIAISGPVAGVANDATLFLRAQVLGSLPLQYQWSLNGTNLLGATNFWLYLANVGMNQAGQYRVVAGNSLGSVASSSQTLAVAPPYSPLAWGANVYGQAAFPASLSGGVQALAGGLYHTLALKRDGTLMAWGLSNQQQTNVPAGLSNVVSIAAGPYHNVVLLSNGTVAAWGRNDEGQCAVPEGLSNVVEVAAGFGHSVALKNNGLVVVWGDNTYGQSAIPAGLSNVVAIASGYYHILALTANASVRGWGIDANGQVDVPPNLGPAAGIAAGGWHSLALKPDGTVAAWGWNQFGQINLPVGLTNVVALAGGAYHSLALRGDGSLGVWGSSTSGQTNAPSGLPPVAAIAAGGQHNLVLVGQEAPMPLLISGPSSAVTNGATVLMRLSALGTPPLQYQWQLDGTDLPGANQGWLILSKVLTSQSGHYSVLIRNGLGLATSPSISLVVTAF